MRANDARALAGGTDLVPQLREGRRRAARIVDLKHIPEMTAITLLPDGGVSIGAAATAAAVARHAAIAAGYPAVAESAQLIGGVQVQNRASLGGNICNAAPSADGVPALICHGAQAHDRRPRRHAGDSRSRRSSRGPGRTTLAAGRNHGCDPAAAGRAKLGRRPICASRRDARWTSRSPARGPGCGLARMAPSRKRGWRSPRSRRRRSARRRPSSKLVGERPSARAVRGGRPARRAGCASDLGHARLRRLSRHAGGGADGARARRLRPQAWS